jgi:hypothetical protein
VAHLTDGTSVSEEQLGTFAKVPLTLCTIVELIPHKGGLSRVRVEIPLDKDAVFFRRHSLIVDLNTQQQVKGELVTCVGWEGAYQFWREDGDVILSSNLQAM